MSSSEVRNTDNGRPSLGAKTLLGLGVFFAGALTLRVLGSINELWLDEVTSVRIARDVNSAWSIFSVQSDNNHLLNTLYLYFVRNHSNWHLYRIPSVAFGMGVVIAGTLGARRYGAAAMWTTAMLLSCGFMQVNYSSEARGYAGMMFFAVVAFLSLERRIEQRSTWALPVFWMSCALGLLAHLIFVTVFAALLLWSAFRLLRLSISRFDVFRELARCHAVPIVCILAIYWGFVRGLQVAGGDPYSTPAVLGESCALIFGLPRDGVWPLTAAALFVLTLAHGIASTWRRKDDLWVFYILAIVVCPAALLMVEQPEVLVPRYFLPGILFFTLLLGRELGVALAGRGASRLSAAAVLLIFVAGNGWYDAQLIRNGRGSSCAALNYIVAASQPGEITIGSDHDFRNGSLVDFYAPYIPQGPRLRIQYVAHQNFPEQGPEWLLLHRYSTADLKKDIADRAGHRYTFEKVFPEPVCSGWSWAIFRNTGGKPAQ